MERQLQPRDQRGFFQFEIIINALITLFRFILNTNICYRSLTIVSNYTCYYTLSAATFDVRI